MLRMLFFLAQYASLLSLSYLFQIETLNEELVGLLVTRDDLVMEQDAMLTDIEDLSEFFNIEKA